MRDFCREINITMDTFTRVVGASRRTVATWVAGAPPNRANQRNVSERCRLFNALAEVVPASQLGSWLDTPNPAFEASTPIEVTERGQSDRIWRMMWELRGGNSGDLRSRASGIRSKGANFTQQLERFRPTLTPK
jgi:hypothetical protein